MAILEIHSTATLAAATPQVIVSPVSPATGVGVGTNGIDNLTILVTNTGANPITAGALARSCDPAGARFSPVDGSVVLPGGTLAPGGSWEITFPSNWPAAYWCKLTLTSTLGTTVAVDFLGHSFSVGVV